MEKQFAIVFQPPTDGGWIILGVDYATITTVITLFESLVLFKRFPPVGLVWVITGIPHRCFIKLFTTIKTALRLNV